MDSHNHHNYIHSLEADRWLFHADVLVDKAHVVMLAERGIIRADEAAAILRCLQYIHLHSQSFLEDELPNYEDVHTAIESFVIREIGEDAGGRMHTARSRNDEVATCIRIALREELLRVMKEVNELRHALIARAAENVETVMPGYTHLQHAQPTTLAHHCLAHADAFARDFARLITAYEHVNMSPLGAAAFAATGFPIDRMRTAKLLGFDSLLENSMDAVSTRDFVIETVSCYANLMTNLSRLAEEIILWSSSEFNFLILPDEYSTGSSIMPQKRNPDYAELVRARTGSVYGCLLSILSICKALPYSYNRDLQEVTPHLMRAARLSLASTSVMRGCVAKLKFNTERLAYEAARGFTTATELADTLVREAGLPFRTAYRIVASIAGSMLKLKGEGKEPEQDIVALIEHSCMDIIGKRLSELGLNPDKVREALDISSNIDKRLVTGGPAREEVMRMIRTRMEHLSHDNRRRDAKESHIKLCLSELEREVERKIQRLHT